MKKMVFRAKASQFCRMIDDNLNEVISKDKPCPKCGFPVVGNRCPNCGMLIGGAK